MSNLTPLMKQYWEIKSLHQDKILFFRMGDFFELFFDDAVLAAPILNITLTQRNKKSQDETPMCGMPHHSVAGPINRLLQAGYKVAICDQIEDPKLAKGIVKRAVTRVLTPGMVYDIDSIDSNRPHYIASYDDKSISFVDTTTGESFYFYIRSLTEAHAMLEQVSAAELVLPAPEEGGRNKTIILSIHGDVFSSDHELCFAAPESARRILSYIQSLGGDESLQNIRPFQERNLLARMELSPTVLRHLEIFSTYKGEGSGSLYHAINRTQTSAGARLLRQWLAFPLRDLQEIQFRQTVVQYWADHLFELKQLRQVLSKMGDIERRLSKIAQPQANARDLLSLAESIRYGLESLQLSSAAFNLDLSLSELNQLADLANEIERVIVDEPPLTTRQGFLIKMGVNPVLDEWIDLSTNAQQMVEKLEAKEKEATGISSLKVRYNNVFGYYIEITHTHKDKVPNHYQRKQTLTNAERYCTDELVELERKVLSAQAKRADLEFEIFEGLRKKVLQFSLGLSRLAHHCSQNDVYSSLGWLAIEQKYIRPSFSEGVGIQIQLGRHPVIEQNLKSQFVANDFVIPDSSCALLTGPNMAGKSTLMRQVAIISILAQVGSFVPATSAKLPIFDAIFTRIGASDQLSEGLSTFMVEMTETSEIIKRASPTSLVLLDEIGRGTSTFDGMSLAQGILEHFLSEVRCITLFATHYHELTALDQHFSRLFNFHMAISEKNGEIRFLHTLVRGPALRSYGIQVAELAGLPSSLTKRAKSLLSQRESIKKGAVSGQLSLMEMASDVDQHQEMSSSNKDNQKENLLAQYQEFMSELSRVSIESLTPIQAMNHLFELREKTKKIVETAPLQ